MHLVYFEQELLDLQQEVHKHPPLLKILEEQPDKDIYIHLCEIAAYCNMLLAGDYTKDDVLELCKIMTKKLIEKRTIRIFTEGGEGIDMTGTVQ